MSDPVISAEQYTDPQDPEPIVDDGESLSIEDIETPSILEHNEIKARLAGEPEPIGVNGWFPRVGESVQNGKKIKGSSIAGQIVDVFDVQGRFGKGVVVAIKAVEVSWPEHVTKNGEVIKAFKGSGTYLFQLDASTGRLAAQLYRVVKITVKKKGGGGVRHEYSEILGY